MRVKHVLRCCAVAAGLSLAACSESATAPAAAGGEAARPRSGLMTSAVGLIVAADPDTADAQPLDALAVPADDVGEPESLAEWTGR